MILDNPGPQKPEREYIRQNRPFTKPPFYLPVIQVHVLATPLTYLSIPQTSNTAHLEPG